MNSKYNALNKADVEHVCDIFDKAIKYCDYAFEYNVTDFAPDNTIVKGYEMQSGEDKLWILLCKNEEDIFYVYVSTAFYLHYCYLQDINFIILSFIMRNATKPTDEYAKSIAFFEKFYNENPTLKNEELLENILNYAVQEQTLLTYVNSNLVKTKKNEA